MSETSNKAVRNYETVVIFNPELGEAQVKDEEKKVEALLKTHGANEIILDRWGKKEIAYIIGKQRFGHFTCFKYNSQQPSVVNNMASILRITESVVKFQSHRLNLPKRKFKGNPNRSPLVDNDSYVDLME